MIHERFFSQKEIIDILSKIVLLENNNLIKIKNPDYKYTPDEFFKIMLEIEKIKQDKNFYFKKSLIALNHLNSHPLDQPK